MKSKAYFFNWVGIFSTLLISVAISEKTFAVDKENSVQIETDHIDPRQAYDHCPHVCAKENREWVKAYDTLTYVNGSNKVIKGRCYCSKEQYHVKADSSEEAAIDIRVDGLTGKATESTPRHNKECEQKQLFLSGEHKYAFDEKGRCPIICGEKGRKWQGKFKLATNIKGYAPCTQNSKGTWVMASNDLICTCEK